MARKKILSLEADIRSQARRRLREHNTLWYATEKIAADYVEASRKWIEGIVIQEFRRMDSARKWMRLDKRKNYDLVKEAACYGDETQVRIHIRVYWRDPDTGEDMDFGHTIQTGGTRRLADVINEGIRATLEEWGKRSSISSPKAPEGITSASTVGPNRYQISYIECLP